MISGIAGLPFALRMNPQIPPACFVPLALLGPPLPQLASSLVHLLALLRVDLGRLGWVLLFGWHLFISEA